MRLLIGLLTMIAGVMCSCGGDDDNSVNAPYVEEYTGTYLVRDLTIAMSEKMDSADLKITDGIYYSLRFRKLDPSDNVEFCDCDGRLTTNTSAVMCFEPNTQVTTGCDYATVPRGDFVPDYVTHRPDTVYFERSVGDSIYQMIVVKN